MADITGPTGPTGATGIQGETGLKGDQGNRGPIGVQGESVTGSIGPSGVTGVPGVSVTGPSGPSGPAGETGSLGNTGVQGSTGPSGSAGNTGAGVTGPTGGTAGNTGSTGAPGSTGAIGASGPTGSVGSVGAQGNVGIQGETGHPGNQGETGNQGIVGPTGPTDGPTGATGLTGAGGTGATGATGAVTVHSGLTGLDQDDHPQYFLADGSRWIQNNSDVILQLVLDSGLTASTATDIVYLDRGTPEWRVGKNSANDLHWISQSTGNVIMQMSRTADASSLVIDAAGNVGIGTALPAAKLHVLGNTRVTGFDFRVDNDFDADTTVTIDSGQSAAQHSHFVFADRGNEQWLLCKPPDNTLFIRHVPDPTQLLTFRPGYLIDLDTSTRFQKASADSMDIHVHAARHAPGGADPLVNALPDKYIAGLTMQKNLSEPLANFQDIAVQPGSCKDADNLIDMSVSGPLVKRFDAVVAKGTAAGGYPATIPTSTISTWYRFFLVGRNVGGEIDAGFDSVANADASALLGAFNTIDGDSSWVHYRQLGWVRTTAASSIELEPFTNDPSTPNEFILLNGVGFADGDPGTTVVNGINAARTITLDFAPQDSVAMLQVRGYTRANSGNSGGWGLVRPVGSPDAAPSRTNFTVGKRSAGPNSGVSATPLTAASPDPLGKTSVRLDSSSQFSERWFGAGSNFYPFYDTLGFFFDR